MKSKLVWTAAIVVVAGAFAYQINKLIQFKKSEQQPAAITSAVPATAETSRKPAGPSPAVSAREEYAQDLKAHKFATAVDVSATGDDETTIVVKYPDVTKAAVDKMGHDPQMMTELHRLGFRKLVFTDDHNDTYTSVVR